MQRTNGLINTLWSQKYLRFYEIMKYPVPLNTALFFQYSETNKIKKEKKSEQKLSFSRSKKSQYMDEYLDELNRLKSVFQSIPFVEQIFLCNSITFNSLNKNSDIDLFIITKPWRIRSVKFRSMLFFTAKNAKRIGKNTRKKICLSFFITSDQQNLYPISLPSMDIYLSYWIAHLVPIYNSLNLENKNSFYSQNKRIKWILPNFTEKQSIFLWINPFSGNTKIKNILEYIWNGRFGNIFERFIKWIQKVIIHIKIWLNPIRNKDVIISNYMLKFHQDIREKISLKYNIKIK